MFYYCQHVLRVYRIVIKIRNAVIQLHPGMEYGAYLAVMSIISKVKRKESHETALRLRWKTAATWDTVKGCRSNGNPGTVVYTAIM